MNYDTFSFYYFIILQSIGNDKVFILKRKKVEVTLLMATRQEIVTWMM